MCFDVVCAEHDPSQLPDRLSSVERIQTNDAVRTREFVFSSRPTGFPPSARWTINGQPFDADRAIANPRLGDTERYGAWSTAGGSVFSACAPGARPSGALPDRGTQRRPSPFPRGGLEGHRRGQPRRGRPHHRAIRASPRTPSHSLPQLGARRPRHDDEVRRLVEREPLTPPTSC